MAKNKSKSGGKQASTSKLANKRLYKLSKQGKLKKKTKKYKSVIQQSTLGDKFEENTKNYHHPGHRGNKGHVVEEEEVDNGPDADDLEYYGGGSGMDHSFLANVDGSKEKFERYKRKRNLDTEEATYEAVPRKKLLDSEVEMKALLPIKNKKGVVPRMIEKSKFDIPKQEKNEPAAENGDGDHEDENENEEKAEPLPVLTTVELFAQRQLKLQEAKEKIASLASSIVENPEGSVRKLKELRLVLEEDDPIVFITVRKLAMVSLMEVFKDIIPGYRIRIASEKEQEQQAKKETKQLRDFEQGLLNNYRHYLEFLEKMALGDKKKTQMGENKKKRRKSTLLPVPPQASKSMCQIAIRCLCSLLTEHPHFNFTTNIVAVVTPFMHNSDEMVSDMVCNAARKVFKADIDGDVSLDLVKAIGRFIKSRNFSVKPKVLYVFLSLKIKEIDTGIDDDDKDKKRPMMRKERFKAFSRRERKRQNKMKELEKEMEEAAITNTRKHKLKLNSEIIQTVFLTYFRILKTARKSVLLAPVLEGLAKFAHLINIDFFNDLFTVLNELIESGELAFRESLHCVQTAFVILSGQGSALNIDPQRFYRHLYSNLFKLGLGGSSSDMPIVLNCLNVMINKRRKQVSHQRVLAYIKRLSTVCLLQSPHSAIGLMACCRSFILNNSKTDLLYDPESHGSGIYLPELDEPEHCNAHNTALYEYHLMRRHYHPITAQYASHMCAQAPSQGPGQLPIELSRRAPLELFSDFDCDDMTFKPTIKLPKKIKKKAKAYCFTELHRQFLQYMKPVEEFVGAS